MVDNVTTPIPATTKFKSKDTGTNGHLMGRVLYDEAEVEVIGRVTDSPAAFTILGRLKALLTGIVLAAGENIVGKVGGIISNPTSTYTRLNDTSPYVANDLVSNHGTAGSITVQSFTAARVAAGSGIIRRLRLVSNHTTGLSGVQFRVRLWSAAPTYTNGDNGVYAVATGGANLLGSFAMTFEQFADAAVAIGEPSVGSDVSFKLASGQVIYWDMQTLSDFTPQALKTFILSPEILQD